MSNGKKTNDIAKCVMQYKYQANIMIKNIYVTQLNTEVKNIFVFIRMKTVHMDNSAYGNNA